MITSICKWLVFKGLYPICYHIGSMGKVDQNKILFVENHQDSLSDNYELLYKQLENKGFTLHTHYLKVASSGWFGIILRTVCLLFDMATAGCVFINESNSVFGSFRLRKGTKLIQVWHACGAFKKWGYSVADKTFGDDRKTLERYSAHSNYTLVPVSGRKVCWAYEEAFGLQDKNGIVKPIGVSRTDVYFQKEREQLAYEKLQNLQKFIAGRKIILYAPTFRGDIRTAAAPNKMDFKKMMQLQEEYVILIKNHPFVKEKIAIPAECQTFCMEITDQLTIEDLIIIADICITDYSSIIFEYALMRRPILFFAYDLEEYYDERGFYYPYAEFVPGPVVRNTEEILERIIRIEQFDGKRLENFCEQYMSGCDGHSTERILEYVL